MKVIITGSAGQLGWELQRSSPQDISLTALNRSELDLTNAEQVKRIIGIEKPDWVINAAAYTAVDQAEQDSELAYRINRDGAENLAIACKTAGSKMLQVSTDFVFDGSQCSPYKTSSKTNPLSIYGASKQQGEDAVIKQLGDNSTIIRTSWVYSTHGNNFVKSMIRLMQERQTLGIISDQIGSPTWAYGLALSIWQLVQKNITGIQHWSDSGVASWYDFAIAIYEESRQLDLIKQACNIQPIRTDQYPLPAKRPQFSVLDKTETIDILGIEPQHWRISLRQMLDELKSGLKTKDE